MVGVEPATGEDEQDEAAGDEHAHEGVQLRRVGQEQGHDREPDADRIDQHDRLAMGQPDVQQPMVEMAAVGRERRSALGDPAV